MRYSQKINTLIQVTPLQQYLKMQLDVEVSPPANRKSLRLTLAHVTFDFDLSDLLPRPMLPAIFPEI